jgi:hypothetical protein
LKVQFYCRLNDSVKDNILQSERPDDLDKIIKIVITIDNRIYKRQLEKRGGGGFQSFGGYRKLPSRPTQASQLYYRPMPIDLSTATQQLQVLKAEIDCRQQNKLCFKYSKPGYQSK